MNPFRGPHGVRAFWRLLAFLVVMNVPTAGAEWFVVRVLHVEHVDFRPLPLILAEGISLAFALLATALMARFEKRRLADYGLPLREAFGPEFREGALWGLAANALVIGLIAACGGYSVSGLAVHGAQLVSATLLWLVTFLGVALFEEVYFRGYPLATLAGGLGSWPAAVVLSLLFGALHYFGKPGETWADGASVTLIALFFCFTIQRTRRVWWAVGWHFTWNWASMGVFGSPNTGNEGLPVPGHLLAGTFHGPQLLTGGGMGAEASLWMFPMLALLFWLFARGHPRPAQTAGPAGPGTFPAPPASITEGAR